MVTKLPLILIKEKMNVMTYKYVEKKILKDTKWIYGLKKSGYIVSYCEKCECQRIHYYVKDCYSKILFECSFCKENKNMEE